MEGFTVIVACSALSKLVPSSANGGQDDDDSSRVARSPGQASQCQRRLNPDHRVPP
jgi:hypothetical protein